MQRFFPICAVCVSFANGGLAAPDDAWAEFRAKVDAACRALVVDESVARVDVRVNPFGSERFGAALVTVTEAGAAPAAPADEMVCIYEKSTGSAELTAPFGAQATD